MKRYSRNFEEALLRNLFYYLEIHFIWRKSQDILKERKKEDKTTRCTNRAENDRRRIKM